MFRKSTEEKTNVKYGNTGLEANDGRGEEEYVRAEDTNRLHSQLIFLFSIRYLAPFHEGRSLVDLKKDRPLRNRKTTAEILKFISINFIIQTESLIFRLRVSNIDTECRNCPTEKIVYTSNGSL